MKFLPSLLVCWLMLLLGWSCFLESRTHSPAVGGNHMPLWVLLGIKCWYMSFLVTGWSCYSPPPPLAVPVPSFPSSYPSQSYLCTFPQLFGLRHQACLRLSYYFSWILEFYLWLSGCRTGLSKQQIDLRGSPLLSFPVWLCFPHLWICHCSVICQADLPSSNCFSDMCKDSFSLFTLKLAT